MNEFLWCLKNVFVLKKTQETSATAKIANQNFTDVLVPEPTVANNIAGSGFEHFSSYSSM